jgi:hypothetical protein
MASTRSTTGSSKPRVFPTVSTEPTRKRATTGKKRTTTKTKANTSKPRSTGVAKKKAPATQHKRKSSVQDKIEGVGEKIVGTVENKPSKKAAGTKKIHGTDGKNSRTKKAVAV